MRPELLRIEGDQLNSTSRWLVVLGYYGSYVVNDANGNEASGMGSSIPYAVLPPSYSLTGGTRAFGILVEFEDLRGYV